MIHYHFKTVTFAFVRIKFDQFSLIFSIFSLCYREKLSKNLEDYIWLEQWHNFNFKKEFMKWKDHKYLSQPTYKIN